MQSSLDSHTAGTTSVHGIADTSKLVVTGVNGYEVTRFCGYVASATAPSSGSWLRGDFVTGSAGRIHMCTASGSPGTWRTHNPVLNTTITPPSVTASSTNALGSATAEAARADHSHALDVSGITITESQVTGLVTDLAGKQASSVNLTTAAAQGTASVRAIAGTGSALTAAASDHTHTKTDVGLGNVDNTADTAKPVSTAQQAALDLKAPLASPALTGTPTVPTAAVDTNTLQAASTAFVLAQGAPTTATPLVDGTAAVGTSTRFSRADHVHPTDTSRLSATASAGGDLAGNYPNPTLANTSTARTNLGLGNSATLNTGTTAGTVAAGDHTHTGLTVQAAGTASVRTIGTGATEAAAGNHTHTPVSLGAMRSDWFDDSPSSGMLVKSAGSDFYGPVTPGNRGAGAAGTVAVKFTPLRNITFTTFRIYCYIAPTVASPSCRFMVWASDGTTALTQTGSGTPGVPQAGTIAPAANYTPYNTTFTGAGGTPTSLTLTAGTTYWIGAFCNAAFISGSYASLFAPSFFGTTLTTANGVYLTGSTTPSSLSGAVNDPHVLAIAIS